MVFQVLLNRTIGHIGDSEILTFPSRQYADEFYNRCITIPASQNEFNDPLHQILRYSPQFWSFSSEIPFYKILTNNHLSDLRSTAMLIRISGYQKPAIYSGGVMSINVGDATADVEYRSGRAYYIRTKSTPHQYWFWEQDYRYVQLGSIRKSKFQIDRQGYTSTESPDDRRVLERNDFVIVTALGATESGLIGLQHNQLSAPSIISIASASSAAFSTPFAFPFGSFYDGNLGMNWSTYPGARIPYLTYRVGYAGEEWELVH
ncbi:hypothetical protein N7486_000253 [Penicillium sp. IBT 16267x]|nr:hypothetical protein N7486_000253 [Penicillium sp. IBT 16267x]